MSVTIKDVAEHAKVSTATVSRVLNNKPNVRADLVDKVKKSVAALGYRPNAVARTLKTKKANIIGVLIPDISNPYFMQVAKGIEKVIAPRGFSLLFASSDESGKKERRLLEVLSERQVDALVVATAGGNEDLINEIHKTTTPIVLVDRVFDNPADDLNYVVEENQRSAYELTSHFIERGVKSFGAIHGPMSVSTGFQRARGFNDALADSAISDTSVMEYYGYFSYEDGVKAIQEFHTKGMPKVVIAFNNLMAYGAMVELMRKEYAVGESPLFGSYGKVELPQLFTGHYPYVEQDPREMGIRVGEIVMRKLIKREAGPFVSKFRQPLKIRA